MRPFDVFLVLIIVNAILVRAAIISPKKQIIPIVMPISQPVKTTMKKVRWEREKPPVLPKIGKVDENRWNTANYRWKGIVGRGFTPLEFRSYVSQLKFNRWTPKFVVLHNTYIPSLKRWNKLDGEQWMKGLTAYYKGKGWPASPHLFIDEKHIWVMTPLKNRGIHSPSWNYETWGVEMVGDYSREEFNSKVRDNTVSAIATLQIAAKIPSNTLRFHGQDPLTTHKGCPGNKVGQAEMIRRIHLEVISRKGNWPYVYRGLVNRN